MITRCSPDDLNHKYYADRGITVCDMWKGYYGFVNWLRDVGPRPEGKYPSGQALYSIDRIDNDGDYEVGNVRWTTKELQFSNSRPSQDQSTVWERKVKKHGLEKAIQMSRELVTMSPRFPR